MQSTYTTRQGGYSKGGSHERSGRLPTLIRRREGELFCVFTDMTKLDDTHPPQEEVQVYNFQCQTLQTLHCI